MTRGVAEGYVQGVAIREELTRAKGVVRIRVVGRDSVYWGKSEEERVVFKPDVRPDGPNVRGLLIGGTVLEARWDPDRTKEEGPWVVDAEGDWEAMPEGFRGALWAEILEALIWAPGVRAAELADEVWGALVAVLREAEGGRVGREELRRVVRTVALTCKGRFTVVSGGG